jgi:hypothetical protein
MIKYLRTISNFRHDGVLYPEGASVPPDTLTDAQVIHLTNPQGVNDPIIEWVDGDPTNEERAAQEVAEENRRELPYAHLTDITELNVREAKDFLDDVISRSELDEYRKMEDSPERRRSDSVRITVVRYIKRMDDRLKN